MLSLIIFILTITLNIKQLLRVNTEKSTLYLLTHQEIANFSTIIVTLFHYPCVFH